LNIRTVAVFLMFGQFVDSLMTHMGSICCSKVKGSILFELFKETNFCGHDFLWKYCINMVNLNH